MGREDSKCIHGWVIGLKRYINPEIQEISKSQEEYRIKTLTIGILLTRQGG